MTTTGSKRKIKQFKNEPLRPGDPRLRPKGSLLIIGGHEDKEGDMVVLRELANHVGSGKLVVSTIASSSPGEMWETYETVFRGLGVRHVYHLNVEARADASDVKYMKILEDATAVFFTGGDQLKITSTIGDTPVFSRIFEIFIHGGMIAGTSAGASVMSETMLVGGGGDSSHRIGESLRLAPGFGFAKDMVIDQHFAERGRIGRLLAVVGQNPRIIGIGIDENTAIEMQPHKEFRVLGEGGVTVLDGRNVTYSNIAEAESGDTVSVFGVTLHQLGHGDVFDLRKRMPDDPADEDHLGHKGNGKNGHNGNDRSRHDGNGKRG
jgi:cyanophycinase